MRLSPARATFTQSGGQNNMSGSGALYLGSNAGSSGSYNLSGSGLLSGSNEYVGFSGHGHVYQSGGQNNMSGSAPFTSAAMRVPVAATASAARGCSPRPMSTSAPPAPARSFKPGGLNAVGLPQIGSSGSYQFGGGTLQANGGGLANQGDLRRYGWHGTADGRRQCHRQLLAGHPLSTPVP